MPRFEGRAHRGRQRGRRDRASIGREFLLARSSAGLAQQQAADAVGISQSQYGRIERGEAEAGLETLGAIAAVLGLDLRVQTYPGGPPIRDAGHVRALGRLRALLPGTYRWRTEVPLPLAGDQRAIDAMIVDPAIPAAFELESRLLDAQRTTRGCLLKARDAGLEVVVLVLPDTEHNRRAVAVGAATLRSAFPLTGREVLDALRQGRSPAENGIVFV